MSENLGLIVDVEARITKLERGLQKANAIQRKAAKAMEKTAEDNARRIGQHYDGIGGRIAKSFNAIPSGLKTLGGAFLGGVAGGIAMGGIDQIAQAVMETTKEVANFRNEAEKAGVSVETWQEWKFVADQNRVGIDAMTDAIKELHIRAGEFFTYGTGAGADAFKKLGYSAEELKEKMKDPSAAMTEILGKLKGLDQAQRSFMLEEIFGGSGEQFGTLVNQGEESLNAMIQTAHDTGAVLDAELVDKAAEIDRKFSQLQTSVAGFGKRLVVEIAAGVVALTDFKDHLDSLFGNEAQGRQILGNDLYNALDNDAAAAEAARATMEQLRQSYQDLGQQAQMAVPQLLDAAATLDLMEQADAAQALRDAGAEMQRLAGEFARGEISADDFAKKLQDVEKRAQDVFAGLNDIDRASFNGVIGELGRLGGALSSAISLAASLGSALTAANSGQAVQALRDRHNAESASMDSLDAMRQATEQFTAAENERNTATSASIRLEREKAAVKDRATAAGVTLTDGEATAAAQAAIAGEEARAAADAAARKAASGGGGGAGGGGAAAKPKLDEFAQEAEAIARRTRALQIESVVLAQVATGQSKYADAAAYVETKTQLLVAAMEAGKAVTPELTASIDAMALAASNGAAAVADGAEKLDAQEDGEKTGKGWAKDFSTAAVQSMRDGDMGAMATMMQQKADALLSSLLEQLLSSLVQGLAGGMGGGGGGIASWLSSAFSGGFASGGYTGDGGKYQPAGIVHAGEYVLSREAVNNLGVSNLERLHQSARAGHRGYASGGLVSGAAKVSRASSATSKAAAPVQNISLSPVINMNAPGGTPEANADLARQVSSQVEKSMRALVQSELNQQMRAGGMLRR